MAAVENIEVQQVFDSSVDKKSFELSSPLRNDFTFLCNGLDSFLESLDSELPKGPGPSSVSNACAEGVDPEDPFSPGCPPPPTNRPRTSVTPKPSNLTKVLLKDYDCPKPLIFFNKSIPVSGNQKFTRSIEFKQRRPSRSVDCLSQCRFPPQLRSLYKEAKPSPEPEPAPTLPKTRRRRQRNRLSLSDHAFDNDDAHGRRNLLPTDEDLRTTFDKIYRFRGIPYIFKCSSGKSCECPSKCSQLVNSFSLYMEISPKPGTPIHPLVRENIDCVTKDSCVVNELSALVAVTAVQSKQPPLNRLFIPVSYHLKDKIDCLEGIIPKVVSSTKIEEPVRRVVTDLIDFVVRQSSFNVKVEYDPDSLSSAENSFNEEASLENIDSVKPETTVERESSEQRKKRGKCKEPNKVLRELRKLMNISVTDETDEVANNRHDVKCSEPSCSLGCVCGSVHEKYHPPPEHCGNIGCMFECVCSEKSREMYLSLGDLSKDEKSWHQTVIRKRNNALEIKSGVDRSKRRKKMPSRYDNTVTGYMLNRCVDFKLRGDKKTVEGKEYRAPVLPKPAKPSAPVEKPKNQSAPVQQYSSKSVFDENTIKCDKEAAQQSAVICDNIRKSLKKRFMNKVYLNNERRLKLMCTEEVNNLLDVMIWCNIHYKYDCFCMNRTIFGKNNNMVCKLPSINRFTAEKYLASISLEPTGAESRQVEWYDQERNCARTAGSVIDYKMRNKNSLFKKKLSHLLNNNIISFSNSFTKANPIATFISDIPFDNHPFVPESSRQITGGVGSVVKISSDLHDSFIDVGGRLVTSLAEQLQFPPDDLKWESSDDEIVDKSDFLLDDDGSEFIPKPKQSETKASKPVNRFCFSSVFSNKSRSPVKYAEKPKSDHSKPEYDSDIELVEDRIETYSVPSSPEPELVDGGTLSDSSSCKEITPEYNRDLSFNSKSDKSNNNRHASNDGNQERESYCDFSNVADYSAVEDDCDSFSSPNKLVIDECVETSLSPVKSLGSDHTSMDKSLTNAQPRLPEIEVLEDSKDDILKQPNSNNLAKTLQLSKKVLASFYKPASSSSDLGCRNSSSPLHGSDTKQPVPVEDDGYPKLGLFCMSLPNLGYLRVKESRPGNFIMEDPCNPISTRTFNNCKEASEHMKQLVGLCINPEYASSEWVMVTRGVLEKYQSKRFDNKQVVLQKKRELETSPSKDKLEHFRSKKRRHSNNKLIDAKFDIEERGQTGLKRNSHLKVQQNISDSIDLTSDDIFHSSLKLMTGQDSAATEKVIPVSGTLKHAPPISVSPQSVTASMANNLVGTFPNLSEANSFIEKAFQSRVIVRTCAAANTPTTGNILTAGTSQLPGNTQIAGKFVRLVSPLLTGPKTRGGVPTNKTLRTVLVRGSIAGQAAVARPVLHIRPAVAGLRVSGPVFQTPTVATVVCTTHAGTSKTKLVTTCPKGLSVIPATSVATAVNQLGNTSATRVTPVKQIDGAANASPAVLTGNITSLVAPPAKNVESSAPSAVSSVATPGKQVESLAESVYAADSLSAEPAPSGPPLPKLSETPRVPGTFVIESFSTSSSPVSTASSPSTIIVRHGRPILPKPVIPKVPPRRADVIVPRNDDFATLISPAPSDSPATKVLTPPENKVFNGVLLPKSDKKEVKAYICRKTPTTKSNYRSLLPKR